MFFYILIFVYVGIIDWLTYQTPMVVIRTGSENIKPNIKLAERLKQTRLLILLALSFPVLMISCSPKTQTTSIPVEMPESFDTSGMVDIAEQWWTVFRDQQLNDLVDTALSGNFNLEVAWYNLMEARAVLDRESATFLPFVDAFFQGEVNRPSRQFQFEQMMRLGLSASYEIDLWGRIGSQVKAASFRAEAAEMDYRAAALSISAEVALVWFRLKEARGQLDLAEEQVRTNEKILNLLQNRFGTGQIRAVDILRQQALLESIREEKILTETRMHTLEHQLAVLLGKSPRQLSFQFQDTLPALPPLPETGLPAELVNRRPDVQSAYKQLQAADRDLATAISNQYPRISLSASFSTAAEKPGNLFQDWFFTLAGDILAPVFYGGQLGAEADRNEAIRQQQLYAYAQAVLNAFREVEDALLREQKQKERMRSLQMQHSFARKAYAQLRVEYFNGMSDYLDVLTALEEEQQLRRDLITAKLNLLEYRVSLYRALAGGFATERENVEQAE